MANVVLIVDDDPNSMKLTYDLLNVCGYTTLAAVNGLQAVEMAKSHIPDLILMDIQLPLMDGLSATRLIKADIATRDIPIIAATAYAMKGDEEKVIEAGCSGYITKPIDIQVLSSTVDKYLANKNTESFSKGGKSDKQKG
ncbi:MAG TPA: response regulator [Dehalococcoidales bacterium]